jgi:cell division protein FtsB
MINWGKVFTYVIAISIIFAALLLFRKYIPYGTEFALMIGVEDQLPTTDSVVAMIKTNPLQVLGLGLGTGSTLIITGVKALTQLRENLAQRQADINRLTGVRESLNTTLQTVSNEKTKIEDQFRSTTDQLNTTRAEFESYKTTTLATVENSTRAVADSQKQINSLSEQNNALKAEIDRIRQQFNDSRIALLEGKEVTSH